jgi:predicted nuclease of predicted toxin-antitoxin system
MGIPLKTVAFLHTLGHDAVHLADQGLERLPDRDIVAKARQEGRILLAHDLGFGELPVSSRFASAICTPIGSMGHCSAFFPNMWTPWSAGR